MEASSNQVKNFRFSLLFGFAVATSLTACEPRITSDAMRVPFSPDQVVADTLSIGHSISLGVVDGGTGDKEFLLIGVPNSQFKLALDEALADSGLRGQADAPYVLDAHLSSVDPLSIGFDTTVTRTVEYSLRPREGSQPVWTQKISTPYTVGFVEARQATDREIIAEAGSIRNNIREVIAHLIADARSGGPLGNLRSQKP